MNTPALAVRLVWIIVLVAALGATGHSKSSLHHAESEANIFATLVEAAQPAGFHRGESVRLRIDPDALAPEAPHHILEVVLDDIQMLSDSVREERKAIIRELGAEVGSLTNDARCLFTGGLREPSKRDDYEDTCKIEELFASIAFSLPRKEPCGAGALCYEINAVEISSHSYHLFRIRLHQTNGTWQVREINEVASAYS